MHKTLTLSLTVGAILGTASAWAAEPATAVHDPSSTSATSTTAGMHAKTKTMHTGNMEDARKQVTEATKVVAQMKRDPKVASLLQQAHGVFILPDYAKAGAIVGGRGGGGVVLENHDGKWSNPAFFNMGGVSVGAQAGVAAGSIAMLLMNEKAVHMFENQANNFSLDANAGFTIVNYSAEAQGSSGKGDVIVWSDTEGAFAGAGIGVSDINRDEDENHAYYGKQVSAKEILTGEVTQMHAENLRNALSTRVASSESPSTSSKE